MSILVPGIALAILLTSVTVFADDKLQRPMTPSTPPTSTGGAKKAAAPLGGLQFSVPYSFTSLHKDAQYALIRCVVSTGIDLPDLGTGGLSGLGGGFDNRGGTPPKPKGSASVAIGQGETKVVLNGIAKSGTASIHIAPAGGTSLDQAKTYACVIMLSDGKTQVAPKSQGAPNVPAWAEARPGSTLVVGGALP